MFAAELRIWYCIGDLQMRLPDLGRRGCVWLRGCMWNRLVLREGMGMRFIFVGILDGDGWVEGGKESGDGIV